MANHPAPPRFEAVLRDPRMLADAMRYHRHTVRSLQDAVNRTPGLRVSRGTIGNLRSGYRKLCNPAVARAVEETLRLPAGSLFVVRVSNYHSDAREAGNVGLVMVLCSVMAVATAWLSVAWVLGQVERFQQLGQFLAFALASVGGVL